MFGSQLMEIDYTPGELEEIDRILGVVSRHIDLSASPSRPVNEPPEFSFSSDESSDDFEDTANLPSADDADIQDDFIIGEEAAVQDIELEDEAVPQDEDLSLDFITDDEAALIESISADEEDISAYTAGEETVVPDDEFSMEADAVDESPAAEAEKGGELIDVTDLLEELPESGAEDYESAMVPSAEFEEDFPSETSAAPARSGSVMEQLEDIIKDEPETLDESDISAESYTDEESVPVLPEDDFPVQTDAVFTGMDADTEEIADFAEIPGDTTGDKNVGFSEDAGEIPDFGSMDFAESSEIPEAAEDDIPDIDFDDLGSSGDDTGGKTSAVPMAEETFDDISVMEDDFSDIPDVTDSIEAETYEAPDTDGADIEPVDDSDIDTGIDSGDDGASMELTERDLRKLRKSLVMLHPDLIAAVKDVILNDRLRGPELKDLVNQIISGKPEGRIHGFLENALNEKIKLRTNIGSGGRKVLTSRPEYTMEGRERQARALKATKIIGGAVAAAFIVTILSYQYIYKPVMAKRLINEGAALIEKKSDSVEKLVDFSEAEKIFRTVGEEYVKNYLYGYNRYALSYFAAGNYKDSLKKLDDAYRIDSSDIDVLNNLGYYYSRVPENIYRSVEKSVKTRYFGEGYELPGDFSQLDLAINFYRRVLVRDGDNIKALLGTGNAYYHQNQFLKAKKYFEDIIKIDKKSIVGHSGLMNIYVERDSLASVAGLHTALRDKGILDEMPLPLLGKLAAYYLSKRKTDTANVRIDSGVLSHRMRDNADNMYPAVEEVLRAVNTQDSDYPPLYVLYALLNREKNNYNVMKRYLDDAVRITGGEDRSNYFAALHLMGEYYDYIKQPVKAYYFLKRASEAYSSQPDFTREDFYHETGHPGHTSSLLGNIFYYYFDRVSRRFGDLDEGLADEKIDRMNNYAIAGDKYREAVNLGWESPELYYNLGRIYYLSGDYRNALDTWLNLYDDFTENPEIMVCFGNAFYHLGNYEAARGEYLKLVSIYEDDAERTIVVGEPKEWQIKLFQALSSSYNNLGAIYARQRDEARSGISFWKSIEYAKRINRENEISRVNLARQFKSGISESPILDENIPFSLRFYRPDMR